MNARAPAICHRLFSLPLDVMGKLCLLNVAVPGHLLFCFFLFCIVIANMKTSNTILSTQTTKLLKILIQNVFFFSVIWRALAEASSYIN